VLPSVSQAEQRPEQWIHRPCLGKFPVSTSNIPPLSPPLTLIKRPYRGRKLRTSLFEEAVPQRTNILSFTASRAQLNNCVVVVKGGRGMKGKKMEEGEFEANVLGENP